MSIIVSAVLADTLLNERLHIFGILGCVLCIVGSVVIILHTPQEGVVNSVSELFWMAMQPGTGNVSFQSNVKCLYLCVCLSQLSFFQKVIQSAQYANTIILHLAEFLFYSFLTVATGLVLIFVTAPKYGSSQVLVYIGICSLFGSLSVMSCKALGIAVKLTFEGQNQLV